MREIEILRFANEAFYRAVADQDMDALEGVWAVGVPVSCLHPGWPPLHGRDEVMESWRRILNGPAPPAIECHAANVHLIGATGLVTCYEKVGSDWLIASNLFVREGQDWAMVHHQSGPVSQPPEGDEIAPTPQAN